jgi:hypothetical protein
MGEYKRREQDFTFADRFIKPVQCYVGNVRPFEFRTLGGIQRQESPARVLK